MSTNSISTRPTTVSEVLFQKYLEEQGLFADFEPNEPGRKNLVDFRLTLNGSSIYCEIKELHEKPGRPRPNGAADFNPYEGIRKEIVAARKKFKEHGDEICVLVLHNISDWEFRDSPWVIYSAMLGDLGFTFPIGTATGRATGLARNAFLGNGKMLHLGSPQNRRIRAIVVLSEFNVPNEEYEKEYLRRVEHIGRQSGTTPSVVDRVGIRLKLYREGKLSTCGRCPRLSVFENPFSKPGLPKNVFQGPFDARYKYDLTSCRINRVFVGQKLQSLEKKQQIDLQQRIERFNDSVVRHFKPRRVILFGSQAYGSPDSGSDVDLLVVFPGNGDASSRSLEIRQFVDSDFPMDLICHSEGQLNKRVREGDFFLQEIAEKGIVLYDAANA